MTQRNALITVIAFMLAILLATATFEVVTYLGLKNQQSNFKALQATNHAANQKRLAEISYILQQTTEARVVAVEKRCVLTKLTLNVLVRVHDSVDAAPFQKNYAACKIQLMKVQGINKTALTQRRQ